MEEVDELPEGRLAELVPEFSETEGLVVKLKITPEGMNNPMVLLEEAAHLKQIQSGNYFGHPTYWAEISLNAKYGSKRSQYVLAQAEVDAIELMRTEFGFYGQTNLSNDSNWVDYLAAKKSMLKRF